MTISRGFLSLLMEEGACRPLKGKLLTFGRQGLQFTVSEFRSLLTRYGKAWPSNGAALPSDDKELFQFLGFTTVDSLDYSNFEGATVAFDLNQTDLPADLIGQYDVVLDGGTSEHVFSIQNVLRNAVTLTKTGGRVIFFTPSTNHMEHGFHMPSPMFFYEYFRANRLDIETCYVVRYFPYSPSRRWEAYAYKRGQWADVQSGGLDGSAYFTFVVARKTERSTVDCVPQQRDYLDKWRGGESADSAVISVPAFSSHFREHLKARLASYSFLYRAAYWAERMLKAVRAVVTGVPAGLQNKQLVARH